MASDIETDGDRDDLPASVQAATEFLKLTESAWGKQREREAADLQFQIPEARYQWDADAIKNRSGGIVDATVIPPQPMLCVSTLDEPIQLVNSQIRAAYLGITIHPLSEDASDETAQTLQGLYRHIEVSSRAQLARYWAADRSTKAGFGVYRVLTEYDPDGEPGDQRITIKRVLYQDSVRLDPFAQEPDFSDATRGMVLERMPRKKFKQRYGTSKLARSTDTDWETYATNYPDWFKEDESGTQTVLVAEYYEITSDVTTKDIKNWKGETVSVPDPRNERHLMYSVVTATEELEPERELDGKYIPLIGLIGREMQPVEGERFFIGMIGPAKNGAQLTNYSASAAVRMAALEPLAPWLLATGQAENKQQWNKSNTIPYNYLEYNQVDSYGRPAGPPQRVQVDVSRLGPSMQLLTMGRDFVQSATATYDPALGKQSTAHRSGRAIVAQQDQTTQATGEYLANLAQVAMPYEAKVVLDLIPHIYDRPGRIATILDMNDKPSQVMLNAPFMPGPNGRPQQLKNPNAQALVDNPDHPAKMFDLNKGRYGVSVTVGKASASRLQAGADAIGAIIEADPQILPLIGPEWMKFQDFPGNKALEDILRKNRDHQFPWLSDNPDTSAQDLAQAQQQIQMLTQQLQQMQEVADKNKAMLMGKQIDAETKKQTTAMQESAESERAAMDREVKLAVAELGAKIERMSLFLEERARLGAESHEASILAQEHANTLEQSDADHNEELNAAAQQAALEPPEPESAGA